MRNKCVANHVMKRDGRYYYVRHIPKDLTQHYTIQRLCFSLKYVLKISSTKVLTSGCSDHLCTSKGRECS